jgi:carboxyl-terminal processing protease
MSEAQRRNLGVMLLLALTATIICLIALCVVATMTGGLVLVNSSGAQHSINAARNGRAPHELSALAQFQPEATPTSRAALGDARQQRRIFNQFWSTVNERYVYPDFNGFDWQAARAASLKRIDAGMSDADFHDMLARLVESLKDEHSSYLSPQEAREEDDDYNSAGSYVGIGIISDVNKDQRYIYVLTVLPGSPAEQAGIKAHDHILTIDGAPSVNQEGESQSRLLRGEEGQSVRLSVRTPGQQPRTVTLKRGKVNNSERVEYRILPGKKRIGYLMVPTLFEAAVADQARDAVSAMTKEGRLDGMIVDLRTNGGGAYPNLRDVLGIFTRGNLGSLTNRFGERTDLRVRASAIANSQTVPMMVLIGHGTESFAEVLAGALQHAGRAKLIGQNTAGNIETLLSHDFEDGSRLWLAEETFRLPSGKNWEGVGVTPDIRIDRGWDEYTADNDPVIVEAVKQLSK